VIIKLVSHNVLEPVMLVVMSCNVLEKLQRQDLDQKGRNGVETALIVNVNESRQSNRL